MSDQPTGARYPAVVALLRRERRHADEESGYYQAKAGEASGESRTWLPTQQEYRDWAAERRELVRQIDAALAALEGATDDGE